ncbi:hypothetical protein [Azohydromonas caseinilytica]|uniref:MxaA protein n=1 Tax=Azohydromonas caseinilytica TaxID=2728836 RepID=A0A848FHT5_9BURK|nr:hypothetical protein [Azohydromonas caseinilytica]NML17411.1 hypothetical protein [Azohydromonas caseinilytica]
MPMPSRVTSFRVELVAAGLLATAPAPALAQTVQLHEIEPRTFGYQLGDLIERHAEVSVPAGWRLDEASLPVPKPGFAIELREARWEKPPWWRPGGTFRLTLRYQVLGSPPAPQLLELPPVLLRFEGKRPQGVRLDGVPVMVSPLVPEPAPERRGFGALQPDLPAPLIPVQPLKARLAAEGLIAVLLLGGLALETWGWPGRRVERPFDQAWRTLRRLPDETSAAQWRQALAVLHQALNRSAGEVLFAPGLDEFLARKPAFAPLRPELERFFALSRRSFFAPGSEDIPDPGWLKGLCRRARALEREVR